MSRCRRDAVRWFLTEAAFDGFSRGVLTNRALDAFVNGLGQQATDQRRSYQRSSYPGPKNVESGNMPHDAHDRSPAQLPRITNLAFQRLTYCKVHGAA